jgi:putative flippase GtrA
MMLERRSWQGLRRRETRAELATAACHAAVSLAGFGVDFAVLHAAMSFGLEAAWARVISLACAVHVTFLLNSAFVFRCLRWERRLARRWGVYMATNAFGNLCNYWIFVTLVSLHHPALSRPAVALGLAAFSAWLINYAAARLIVFGDAIRLRAADRARAATAAGLRRRPAPQAPSRRAARGAK